MKIEDLLFAINEQVDILKGTKLNSKMFNVLSKCYSDLVDIEMELD